MTTKKNKPHNQLMTRSKKNNPLDFFETPEVATRALLKLETFEGTTWEPAAGRGAISNILNAEGIPTMASDIKDYGAGFPVKDFMETPDDYRVNNIITNPPYSLAEQFFHKAMLITEDKTAFLLRLMWLEGIRRAENIYKFYPLKTIGIFSFRIPVQTPGDSKKKAGGMVPYMWLIFDKKYKGPPMINWITRKEIIRYDILINGTNQKGK